MNNTIYETDESKIAIELLYEIGGYHTYSINVATKGFAGKDSFCISKNVVMENIKTIENMIASLNGECEIRDCESDAYIKVYFKDSMSFYVKGELGGSHNENVLKFTLRADQTLLNGLRHNLIG